MANPERRFIGVLLGTVLAGVGIALAGIHLGWWPSPDVTAAGPDTTWPGVVFATDRPSYAVGETVGFAVRNVGAEHIHLSCSAPWSIARSVGGTWRPVEAHGCLGVWITLGPGGSLAWTWESVTTRLEGLEPIVPGPYRISLPIVVHAPASSVAHETVVVTASVRFG